MEEEKLTPMMVQYRAIKEENKDKVLFFRLGDFYEMFDEDAVEVSRLLNLTLTHRAGRPMCGIPFHAAKSYLRRLLDCGKKIAICEQFELADDPKKLAKREVIQIVTPATVVDDDFLDARSTNYILSVHMTGKLFSISYADITSGEFVMTTRPLDNQFASMLSLLEKVKPREILVNEDDYFANQAYQARLDSFHAMVTKLPRWAFKQKDAFKSLCDQLGVVSLKAFGFEENDPSLQSGGALLSYLKDTSKASLAQISAYQRADDDQFLIIDESSQKNLELLSNLQDGGEKYTLFSAIDETVTSGGARLLKQWLAFPLRKTDEILKRQVWVTRFVDDKAQCKNVRQILSQVLDLQRLTSRLAMHRCYPQDLVGIEKTVECFFSLMQADQSYQELLPPSITEESLSSLLSVMQEVKKGINEMTQGPFKEGEVVNRGYDEELDRLRDAKQGGKGLLDDYLAKVKAETGITNLKLSSNKIIGHYLEVSKSQVDRVPSTFFRKQTLVGGERYTTDELTKLEGEIIKSGIASEAKEKEVYAVIETKVASCTLVLQSLAIFLSKVDVLSSLATCATLHGYSRPEFVEEDSLSIVQGRHPVVEEQLGEGNFVSNDLAIGSDHRFCLITGPNMAGKSTYLRQNALIVLLAQIGSYVPAKRFVFSPVDRLFCRVGASDNLARGESTFLVEMQEAALILRSSTRSSLVIMDELGRGTSSQDGLAIAYAVMKELVVISAKTLFATHYHELTDVALPQIQLLTLKVVEENGEVVFLRKVIPGVAESSYGLNVAKLAGIPYPVLREAGQFQKRHADDYYLSQTQPSLFAPPDMGEDEKEKTRTLDELRDALDHFDVNASTPLEALSLVGKLKGIIEPKVQ